MVERDDDGQHGIEVELQLVAFRLSAEDFGVAIRQVREIIRVPDITRIPHAPSYIQGVINIRGEVIPVVDLRRRFGLDGEYEGDDARIIVAEVESGRVGLQVDAVTEVLRVPLDAVERPPENVAGLRSDYITGIGRLDDRLLIVLDVHRIFSSEEQAVLEQVAS